MSPEECFEQALEAEKKMIEMLLANDPDAAQAYQTIRDELLEEAVKQS